MREFRCVSVLFTSKGAGFGQADRCRICGNAGAAQVYVPNLTYGSELKVEITDTRMQHAFAQRGKDHPLR